MKNQPRNRLLGALGSTKLTLLLLAAFAVAIAVATFIEVRFGTEGARSLVYNAHWFEILLALLVVNLILSLVFHFPYHVRQTGFVITHIGFIVVLVAAAITRFMGYEGSMPIREGSATDYLYSSKDYIAVSDGVESEAFSVRLYKPGKNNVSHRVTLGSEPIRVSVDEYFPHYETRLVRGEGGVPAIIYTAAGMQHGQREILRRGEEFQSQGVTVHFVESDHAVDRTSGNYGDLVVHLGDDEGRLPVTRDLTHRLEIGGYRFRVKQFAPSFQVGKEPSLDDPMANPAIRVAIAAPDGTTGERVLFAYHPDFTMGHSGEHADFGDLDMAYEFSRSVSLRREGSGVSGRADFALTLDRRHDAARDSTTVAAGESFALEPGAVFRAGEFAFVIHEVWDSAVEKAVLSTDGNQPPAVRIGLQDRTGTSAEALVPRRGEPVAVDLGDRKVQITYGPQVIDLPYRLYLDDFVLVTYPGSENPASFESHVRIHDEERGVDGEPVRIYMNHPLSYRGFKHFQSSYDRDRLGTVLSVNHDPGKLPTYIGYILIGAGFLVTLTRGLWFRPAAAGRAK